MEIETKSTAKISSSAKIIAKNLLQLEAVQLNTENPFTWASGIKSPIYCDNRKINSDIEVRNIVANAFVKLITDNFPNVAIIAGVATGGIPMGMLIADRMKLPFIYVRQVAKEHGLMKQVEGSYKPGSKVVLIEDLISTGGSSLKAVQGLRNENLELLSLISIMTYGFQSARQLFESEHINQWSLCDLDAIIEVSHEMGSISDADRDLIVKFKNAH
jgi:orotate phosphoribosyltransferase